MEFTTYTDFTVEQPEPSIQTVYPTKDWVISDYIVTDYGARAEPGFDNREAFQAAIDAAYDNGGGVVFVPVGNYEFRSTLRGDSSHRVNNPDGSVTLRRPQYVLKLPVTVQLRGDWADPEKNNGRVLGTILEVRVASNATSSDTDRFIEMAAGTGVSNLSIWYPEQDITNVAAYGWSLYFNGNAGSNITIENVTLVNSYNGFYNEFNSHQPHIRNSYMTVLNTGIEIHANFGIARIENVKIHPKYWAESGLPGAPPLARVRQYTRANGTGYKQFRSDWAYVSYLQVSGYKIGMWKGKDIDIGPSNGQFYGIQIDDCETGLYAEEVDPAGLMFSSSRIAGDTAAFFHENFFAVAQFNGVDFSGPIVISPRRLGIAVVTFEHCTFNSPGSYAVELHAGSSVVMTQCNFMQQGNHVKLGANTRTLKSLNSGFGAQAQTRILAVTDESGRAVVEVVNDAGYLIDPPPALISVDRAVFPRPASNMVVKADFPREWKAEDIRPSVDVSAAIQAYVDALAASGGGTLYLKGGRYLVNSPIVIPSGVELRGIWEGPSHAMTGGSALFTYYDGGSQGENGPSLIQLQPGAGIRGIKIVQVNLFEDPYSIDIPLRAPFLVQGQGADVHIVHLRVPLSDRGIDLFSHKTDRHYVDYFTGVGIRAGIWAGGGADGGYIRNTHLNPTWAWIRPAGNQGYPLVPYEAGGYALNPLLNFQMNNYTGIRIGDVKNQTIFNNFVMFPLYGIKFVKDEVTGNYPGDILMIGHGSDITVFSLCVEEAGPDTRIRAVNTTLVGHKWENQPVAANIRVGVLSGASTVDSGAQLILYNSLFFGASTAGVIVNNGMVTFRQTNFSGLGGITGIDLRGGSARVYTAYFPQPKGGEGVDVHALVHAAAQSAEFSNNLYSGRGPFIDARSDAAAGSDVR